MTRRVLSGPHLTGGEEGRGRGAEQLEGEVVRHGGERGKRRGKAPGEGRRRGVVDSIGMVHYHIQ